MTDDQFHHLEQQHNELRQEMRDRFDKLGHLLMGDAASDNTPGIIVRLDRLEKKISFATWLGGSALAGAVTALVGWIAQKITGK